MADDADTALLDLTAFILSNRLDDGVGSPADAVDDGCEAPVFAAASRSMKLILASTAFSLSLSNDNSLNLGNYISDYLLTHPFAQCSGNDVNFELCAAKIK